MTLEVLEHVLMELEGLLSVREVQLPVRPEPRAESREEAQRRRQQHEAGDEFRVFGRGPGGDEAAERRADQDRRALRAEDRPRVGDEVGEGDVGEVARRRAVAAHVEPPRG